MGSKSSTKYSPLSVGHPGDTVVEYLEFHGWSQRDLSRRTGLTPKTISEICNRKAPITTATSLVLEKAFQRPAQFWAALQSQYDEATARQLEQERSRGWSEWAAKFPIKELKRRKWIEAGRASDTDALLGFLGVSSPESWKAVWTASAVAYRQTRKFRTSAEAISAWVRATELYANQLEVQEFDEARLRASIDILRRQSRLRADQIMEPVQAICGAAGVAVVWVPELQQTGISGCARWIGDRKALLGLSLRYKTDDQMWFTFFHELGHLLLHRNKHSFVLDNASEDFEDRVVDPEMRQVEDEANRFAADTLIPPDALSAFIAGKRFDNEAIHDFAESNGIGPGLVVGRLQYEGILARHQGNTLKQKLAIIITDGDD